MAKSELTKKDLKILSSKSTGPKCQLSKSKINKNISQKLMLLSDKKLRLETLKGNRLKKSTYQLRLEYHRRLLLKEYKTYSEK